MNKNLIYILFAVALIGAIVVSLSSKPVAAPTATNEQPQQEEPSTAPTPSEPEPVSAPSPEPADYIGLSVAAAQQFAAANNELFRVVEADGEPLAVTEDWRPGRINAVTENGIVTSYTIEGADILPEEPVAGQHDDIIGMTETEAESYASSVRVPFRIGSVDGEPRPVTMDYRPGRITAALENGIVTSYTVE